MTQNTQAKFPVYYVHCEEGVLPDDTGTVRQRGEQSLTPFPLVISYEIASPLQGSQ